LNPAEYFEEIVQTCRATILTGGTMEPVNDLVRRLLPNISPDRICRLSCGHVIPPDHLLVTIVPLGPSGIPLSFTYETRHKEDLVSI
jgi:chromosome transmission fidelity protein 1